MTTIKRKQKSKEALLALFEREGYEEVGDSFEKGNAYFHYEMFMDCEKELNVIESKTHREYEFENSEHYIKEEWLEPIEEPMKVMVLPEKMLRRALRLNGYRERLDGSYLSADGGVNSSIFMRCEKEIEVKFVYGKIYDENLNDWNRWFFVPISLRRAEVQQ